MTSTSYNGTVTAAKQSADDDGVDAALARSELLDLAEEFIRACSDAEELPAEIFAEAGARYGLSQMFDTCGLPDDNRAQWLTPSEWRALAFETLRRAVGRDWAGARRALDLAEQACEIAVPASNAGVYFILANDRVKIGYSGDLQRRLRSFRTACPYPLTVVAVIEGDKAREAELHRRFAEDRVVGEWFRLSDQLYHFLTYFAWASLTREGHDALTLLHYGPDALDYRIGPLHGPFTDEYPDEPF